AGLGVDDLASLVEHTSEWVHSGATVFRRAALADCPHDPELRGVFADRDWSLRARHRGWELATAPLATARRRGALPLPATRRFRRRSRERGGTASRGSPGTGNAYPGTGSR